MMEDKALDIFGVKPVAAAIDRSVEGIGNFLSRICTPAADELGLLLQDHVKVWRANNAGRMLAKAKERIEPRLTREKISIHPRLLSIIVENGSWTDDSLLHDMWAGLLAASCSVSGRDETNLALLHLLSRMTSAQVRLLNCACKVTPVEIGKTGLVFVDPDGEDFNSSDSRWFVSTNELLETSGALDVHALDMDLDYMRELGLLFQGFVIGDAAGSGLATEAASANMAATPLGINLFVRCQGHLGSAADYFGLAFKPQ